MQELMCFNAFLYQYIESFAFLEPGCKEGATPPPKSATMHDVTTGHNYSYW